MRDLSDIEKYYKSLPDASLKMLAAKPHELRKDALPILREELRSRKLEQEANALEKFIVDEPINLREMTIPEIRQYMDDRVAKGDSLEDINFDLKQAEIDIFEISNYEIEKEEKAMDTFLKLKGADIPDDDIEKWLEGKFSMNREEVVEKMRSKLHGRAKWNIIVGYFLIGLGILLLIVSIAAGKMKLSAFFIIVAGVALVYSSKQHMKL